MSTRASTLATRTTLKVFADQDAARQWFPPMYFAPCDAPPKLEFTDRRKMTGRRPVRWFRIWDPRPADRRPPARLAVHVQIELDPRRRFAGMTGEPPGIIAPFSRSALTNAVASSSSFLLGIDSRIRRCPEEAASRSTADGTDTGDDGAGETTDQGALHRARADL
jgi:hypothetical protein